jgi:hypothetical protein
MNKLEKPLPFRLWYEYEILGYPPCVLEKKYEDTSVSSICAMMKRKRHLFEISIIPDKWLCERAWRKDLDLYDYYND